MNEIIQKLLDWGYEHDYDVSIDAQLTDKPFPYVRIELSRNTYHVQHVFSLYVSENENLYPSTKWFDKGLDYELQSFLEFADDKFSKIEEATKNDGKV